MTQASLVRATERFAHLTVDLSDEDLDLEWAWQAYDSEGVRFAFFRTYEDLRELAVRSAALRAARGPALTQAQAILAQYHAAHRDLQASLLATDAQDAGLAPAQGEWPLQQVLKHIVGADLGFYCVVKYALERHRTGDGQSLAIPDEAWDLLLGADEATIDAKLDGPWDDLLAYYQTVHDRTLHEFGGIGDDELAAPSVYWEGYELPLRFRLHRFDSHLRQHTVQADKTLVGIGRSPTEALRLLRLIYAALAQAEGAIIGAWDLAGGAWDETAQVIDARTDEIAAVLERG